MLLMKYLTLDSTYFVPLFVNKIYAGYIWWVGVLISQMLSPPKLVILH